MSLESFYPGREKEIAELRKKASEYRSIYYKKHSACPNCNSDRYSSTLVGYVMDIEYPEKYKDQNRVTCSDCGWKGIYHDLVEFTEW